MQAIENYEKILESMSIEQKLAIVELVTRKSIDLNCFALKEDATQFDRGYSAGASVVCKNIIGDIL